MSLNKELSYDEAVDELIANSCTKMLLDSKAVTELARRNMSLAEKIADALDSITEKIRAAFEDVDLNDNISAYDAARMIEDVNGEVQKLFDKALLAADENYNAEQVTGKKISAEGGEQRQALDNGGRYTDAITMSDVQILRSITNGKEISINDLTPEDIKKTQKWAYLYWNIMKEKSPFFRAWFGEWRSQDKRPIKVSEIPAISDDQFQDYLTNNRSAGIENADTGWSVRTSGAGERNTRSHASHAAQSVKALTGINNLIKAAVLLDSEVHNPHGKTEAERAKDRVAFDHKLYALGQTEDGNINLYRITVEDRFQDSKHPNDMLFHNLYHIETVAKGINKAAVPDGGLTSGKTQSADTANARRTTAKYTIADLYSFVKKYGGDRFNVNPHDSIDPALLNKDGTPKVFYHGTASDFWAFDMKKATDKTGRLLGLGAGKGKIYLTEYEASAKMAASGAKARTKNGQERVLPLYVSAEKVMDRADYNAILNKNYAKYPNSRPGSANYDYQQRDKAIADTDKEVRRNGYDAVYDESSGEIFVYDNTQVKSATDNIGTFDKSNPDVRYQKLGTAETAEEQQARKDSVANLKAENRILRARAEYWRDQTRQTKERTVRQQDTDRLANALLKKYESKTDKAEVKAALKDLGDWLVQSNGDTLTYDELRDRAEAIAEEIIDGNYTMIDDSNKESLERLKDFLKSNALNISKSDFNDTGDENFRRKYGRYFTVRENGRSIDSVWGELASMFGEGLFPEDVYAPGDMLNMIGDYLDLWKPQYTVFVKIAIISQAKDLSARIGPLLGGGLCAGGISAAAPLLGPSL